MIVLLGSLFVLASGVMWIVFRDLIARNLPVKENPSRRDITPDGLWTPLKVGIVHLILGTCLLAVHLIWFR